MRLIRSLINASDVLSSPRYIPHRHNLYHLVSRPSFTGYWIIQSSFGDPQPPQYSDVTIFYLHGGGYFSSQPETYILFLLRLAESILEQGLSISIFALDYHLAPECPYPTQLNEAEAAYRYLLDEININPMRIVVAGDSAGGHLALSLLAHLQNSLDQSSNPDGLALFSPWLSLNHTPSTNAERDVISAPFLKATAKHFLGPYQGDKYSPLLEFLNPQPPIAWDTVLPSWVWTSAGTNEVMFDDIRTWAGALEQSLGKKRIECESGIGQVHDWQWLETMDDAAKRRFLKNDGEREDFEAIVKIGRVIAGKMKR